MEVEVDDKVGGFRLGSPASLPVLLPDDLVVELLLRLPIKKVHQCNCVSKGWQSLIKSPEFVVAYKHRHPDVGLLVAVPGGPDQGGTYTAHFYYSTLVYYRPERFVLRFQLPWPRYNCDRFTEVIHGLVCFYNRDSLFVCNIFTKEVKPLPYCNNAIKYFFGYDAVNGVYKLLCFNLHSAQVLTLGIGSDYVWKMVDDFDFPRKGTFLRAKLMPEARSFCFDGVMYWLVVKGISRWKSRCFLVSFDLNEKNFRYIKVPPGSTSQHLHSQCFVTFRGKLALSTPTRMGGYKLSLNVLEDAENHVWTKHSVPLPEELDDKCASCRIIIPVGNLPDGRMLLVNPQIKEEFATAIYSYDHQSCKFERFRVGKFPFIDLVDVSESSANISCAPENLAALDVLFSGAKPI
ncbi:OLC1v1022031C3 [Oldenlandia corymbosa var. corymbosa]|uniref:OLC1v1022031C3 n=1 Tax=Oldenlandia corymbosa var. corymbosa TaxID=529605 RepID=A0AAV1BXK4_OLDCO|nr:OLC1v1022031C3 [Oldenlandia corymbosa var. corymbosa]